MSIKVNRAGKIHYKPSHPPRCLNHIDHRIITKPDTDFHSPGPDTHSTYSQLPPTNQPTRQTDQPTNRPPTQYNPLNAPDAAQLPTDAHPQNNCLFCAVTRKFVTFSGGGVGGGCSSGICEFMCVCVFGVKRKRSDPSATVHCRLPPMELMKNR